MRTLHLPQVDDESQLARIAAQLRPLISGNVRFSRHERMLYATDASIYQVEPLGVVEPRDLEDVRRLIEFCNARNLPLLPRGGGTSLAGQAVNRAVVIDFSRFFNRILDIDRAAKRVRVEPGVVLAHLNRALLPHGLMFGPDVATATHAVIGGMIGNNSAGAHSILYGRTVEHLDALDVLLANGEQLRLDEGAALRDERIARLTKQVADVVLPLQTQIDERFPKNLRHVDGYNLDLILQQLRSSASQFEKVNLAHLFCGSEGTLGVTIGATLRLVDAPKCKALAVIAFAGVDEALAAVNDILGTQPAAVELLDDVVLGLAKNNAECRRYVDAMPRMAGASHGSLLYVEYFAADADELARRLHDLERLFANHPMKCFTAGPDMAMAWKLRAAGEPLLHGLPGLRKPITFVEDAAVDPSHLPQFVREFRAVVERHGTTAAYYAHASVGCLHVRPLVNLRDRKDRTAMKQIAQEVADLAVRFGGAISGEHGDGRLRSHLLQRYFGRDLCAAFAAIKRIFDPKNLMNPGVIVEPQPMLESLRVKPNEQFLAPPAAPQTFFRYESEHGFGEVVERCNGAGVCRKMSGGTMCPSYRATRDERHATRGRGNALRLAITGQLSHDGAAPLWNDPETLATLDLCLSCKACKSECPSNVDIARLKAEYLAHSWEIRGGAPFTARMIGNVRTVNRIGSAMYPLANAMAGLKPARMILNRLLGIDERRSLPTFARSLLKEGGSALRTDRLSPALRAGDSEANGNERGTVILFTDCFTTYNEPHIGRAAIDVLESLGYRVVLPDLGCCGRSLISVGMLREAQRTCAATARALIDALRHENAVAVVGCEPSCVSAIIDDWQDLDMDVDRSALADLKDRTFAVEEFAARAIGECNMKLDGRPGDGQRVLLHAHCHQKALYGCAESEGLLVDHLGARFTTLDSGCCGMAGAFGFTADHFDISQEIGELALFPALRDDPDAILLAPGTSCRHQVRDALGREALHPIEFIRALLQSSDARATKQ